MAIHEALRESKIPHALGGALALAYYAEPRATIDIDLNVFVPTRRRPEVIDVLAGLGIDVGGLDSASLERDGQCRIWWGSNPVDLFFSYDPIHEEMRREVRRVPFAAVTVPILGPEHLVVCKAMFDRPKDWIDIEQVLAATEDIDIDSIESWLRKMAGDSDHRLRQLTELRRS